MDSAALVHHESANLNLSDGWGILQRGAQRPPDTHHRQGVVGSLSEGNYIICHWR